MASYIQGVTDYIPQLQSFHPDLNYYSNILQTKQSQYDSAHKQINQSYGTLLNAPMTRMENLTRRDKFFKTIDTDVKKIAKLDLSQEQNVTAAMNAFRPIYNDKSIVNDMVWTRQKNNAIATGENFRACIDPDKCGGSFWEDGLKRINYETEEFKNASTDEALRIAAPNYVPFVNLNKNAIKEAKAAGFNVTQDTIKGGYKITDHNGNLLSGDKDKWGILPNYLYGIFKDDQKVMDVFRTKAYVERKDYGIANALNHGGDIDSAEMEYVNHVLGSSIKNLTTDAEKSKQMYAETDNNLKVLSKKVKNDGGIIEDSPEDSLIQAYTKILDSKQAAEAHHDTVLNSIQTATNLQDPKALKRRADDIIAYNGFRTEIWNASNEYAMGTAKQELTVDPYSMENVRFNHEKKLKDYEFDIWKNKQQYEQNQNINKLVALGLSPEQAQIFALQSGGKGFNKKDIDTFLRDQKVSPTGKDVAYFGLGATDYNLAAVTENDRVIDRQHAAVAVSSTLFLKKTADVLKDAYNSKDPDIKDNALKTLKNIFQGTKFNVESFLNNQIGSGDIDKIGESDAVGRYKVAANMADKPEAHYWSPKLVAYQAEATKNKQIFEQMAKSRSEAAKTTISNWVDDVSKNMTGKDRGTTVISVGSIQNQDGSIRSFEDAKKVYANAAAHYYDVDPGDLRSDGEGGYYRAVGREGYEHVTKDQRVQEAKVKAEKAFDKSKYEGLVKEYGKRFTESGGKQFLGTSLLQGVGGTAVQKAKSYNVNPADVNSEVGLGLVNTIANNPEAQIVTNSPIALKTFLSDFENDYKVGNKAHNNANFEVQQEIVPVGINGSTEEAIRYKVTPTSGYILSHIAKKDYDPSADYSWTFEVLASEDKTGFSENTRLTGAQMLMNMSGKTLSYSNPTFGNVSLHHDPENGYYYTGTLNAFDTEEGKFYEAPIPTQYLQDVDADKAYANMVNAAQNYYYKRTQKDKQEYLKTHKNKS